MEEELQEGKPGPALSEEEPVARSAGGKSSPAFGFLTRSVLFVVNSLFVSSCKVRENQIVKGKDRGKKDEETRSGDKVSPNGNNLMHLISQRMNLMFKR